MSNTDFAEELKARGLIEQTGGGELVDILATKRKVYLGVDPTSDSLHVGHLVPVFLMKHLADAGNAIVFLVGGGTGMIGDPRDSGERVLLDDKTVKANTKAVKAQLKNILGKQKYTMFNNADWLSKLSLIEFLRDTAKHFTVNQLIKRDIIKRRIDNEAEAISFTEFSYSLLQGYDFWYLNKKYGVDLQVGGSDQWANIISGVELVRRREQKSAYAITTPIIVDKKSGKKFGKSEGNAVWLDPKKTSPFAFYQFWLNVADDGVTDYLKIFTFLSMADIASILVEHNQNVSKRVAQRRLALEVTTIVHGRESAQSAEKMSEIFYGNDPMTALAQLSKNERELVKREIPNTTITAKDIKSGFSITDALINSTLTSSKGEAKRLIEGKAIRLNEKLIEDATAIISPTDFIEGSALLRSGKKVSLLTLSK